MNTRDTKQSGSPNSITAWNRRIRADTRARELAAAGRETGLAASRTPQDILDAIRRLVRRDGWTTRHYVMLDMLVKLVPERHWRSGTCDPVVSYPIQELARDCGVTTATIRKSLYALTARGALWFERRSGHEGEYGDRYHIDLAPMIVLDAEVRRRVSEIEDELAQREELRDRTSALRRQIRQLLAFAPPELAHTDQAAAFENELNEIVPAKRASERVHSSVLRPIADALSDLRERCLDWRFRNDRVS